MRGRVVNEPNHGDDTGARRQRVTSLRVPEVAQKVRVVVEL